MPQPSRLRSSFCLSFPDSGYIEASDLDAQMAAEDVDMDIPNPLSIAPEALRRFTVAEYHRMIEVGLLYEDDPVELISGVLVTGAPPGPLQAFIIQRLNKLLVLGVGEQLRVRPRLPLTLREDSEPEPTFAVVLADRPVEGTSHPSHALLAIEVTVGESRMEREVKGPLYASANIPEYWIVNVGQRCIEMYRDPDPAEARYTWLQTYRDDEPISPLDLPGLSLTPHRLFADREA